MSRFDIETKTIHAEWWAEGETVTIKKFQFADRQAITSALMPGGITTRADEDALDDMTLTLAVDKTGIVTLLRGVHSWTFTNSEGKVAPVDEEHLMKLPEEDADFILQEIDDFNSTYKSKGKEAERLRKRANKMEANASKKAA